jgi:hypothetical protein
MSTNPLADLRDILADLYSDTDTAKVIAVDAGLAIARIKFNGAALAVWQDIVDEARKSDKVAALIDRAKKDFGNSDALEAAAEKALAAQTKAVKHPASSARIPTQNELRKFIADNFSKSEIGEVLSELTDALQKAGKQEAGRTARITRDDLDDGNVGVIALSLVQYLGRRGWYDFLPPIVQAHRSDEYAKAFGA